MGLYRIEKKWVAWNGMLLSLLIFTDRIGASAYVASYVPLTFFSSLSGSDGPLSDSFGLQKYNTI